MMRLFLAAASAATVLGFAVTPAAAIDRPGMQVAAGVAGVTVHRGKPRLVPNFESDRFDRRLGRRSGADFYLGDREYQGDSAWRPEAFNDWWHERPLRSEPRWLRSNNCERQYWTGGGWRC